MLNSFYPVVAGRTSDASSRYRSLYQVQVGKIGLQTLETQISTGQRFQLPSQDPSAAIRVIGLQRELEFRSQTQRNLESAQGYLNATETNLADVQNIMNDLRGLGLEAAGNLSGEAERAGWISQIDASIDRLRAVANSKHLDRYLFSGGTVGTPAVQSSRSGIRFTGNDLTMLGIADVGDYVSHNVTGQRALGLVSAGVVGRVDLNPDAIETTRIADLNGGQGIAPGAITFSNGTEQVTIDLADAEFVGDILAKVNGNVKLDGRDINISLSGGALIVNYADAAPGTLRVLDVGSGRTAADLGIATSDAAPTLPIQGTSLDPILSKTTTLAQLNGGLGFNWSDGLQLVQNGRKFTVLFSGAQTVEDVLNRIHRTGASVLAEISPDGRGLQIRSTESGTDFSVGELNGGLAEALGLRTLHGQTRLSELNYGRGLTTTNGSDIVITRNDGSQFNIDLDNARTIDDVLNTINNHVDNQIVANKITAQLNPTGNGIQITSDVLTGGPANAGPIRIRSSGGSQVGWDLGLVAAGETESVGNTVGTKYVIQGSDSNPQEVEGVFNSLRRLRNAIESQDSGGVSRAINLIDKDISRLSLSRGSLGVEQQRIDSLKELQASSEIELKADKARNLEIDMADAISQLNAKQVSYEASLRLLANASQLSLFNYL